MRVLLIGEWDDRDLMALDQELGLRGVETVWLQLGLQALSYEISWQHESLPTIIVNGLTFDESMFRTAAAILFKLARVDSRALVSMANGSDAERSFAEREWNTAILSAVQLLLDNTSVPAFGSPRELTWQEWKLYALSLAGQFGISVPQTTVSNRLTPSDLVADYLVAKSINSNPSIDTNRYYPTTSLNEEITAKLTSGRTDVPSLIQRGVERHHEVRSVLLGRSLVERALYADPTITDIKYADQISVELVTKRDGGNGLLALAYRLGLSYCCFDTIVDIDGTEWLVDITPRGSWYWLDALGSPAVSKSVADVLIGRSLL